MKRFSTHLLWLLLSTSFSQPALAQVTTTRSLTWNKGSQNWPTSATAVVWTAASNWVITGTAIVPATGVANGDKLIIPNTAGLTISVNANMSIPYTNFVIEVIGNGLINIRRGITMNFTAISNTAFELNAAAAGRGLTLSRQNGATPTRLIMNGIVKALNTSGATISSPATGKALGSDPTAAAATGFAGFLAGLLPAVLTNFTANLDNSNKVILRWITQQESNTKNFSVEKSTDGSSWKSITLIPAAGYSATPLSYEATDASNTSGSNFYRIIIYDLDGKTSSSEIRLIHINSLGKTSIYPNPSSDILNVSLSQASLTDWTLALYNQNGQKLLQNKYSKTQTNIAVPVARFMNGNYLLQVTAGNKTETHAVLIQHR